jgi:hypothetical protein
VDRFGNFRENLGFLGGFCVAAGGVRPIPGNLRDVIMVGRLMPSLTDERTNDGVFFGSLGWN